MTIEHAFALLILTLGFIHYAMYWWINRFNPYRKNELALIGFLVGPFGIQGLSSQFIGFEYATYLSVAYQLIIAINLLRAIRTEPKSTKKGK